MNRKLILSAITLIILVAVVGAFGMWYSYNQNPVSNSPAQVAADNSRASSMPNSHDGTMSYPVLVYFSKHSESDNNPNLTFPVERVAKNLGVARYAVSQLFQGPTAAERDGGYFNAAKLRAGLNTCGEADFNLTIAGGTAKLQLCKPFDHLGVVSDGQADSEIKATLKQFTGINKVIILNSSGNCEFDLSGQNLCLQ
jgi:hypothetical protein